MPGNGETRYCITSDGDHKYAVPVQVLADWYLWLESQDAEDGMDPPARFRAVRIDGHFTFVDPRCD